MSVLLGSQPTHMQCNLTSRLCRLCDYQVNEDVTHILIKCDRYDAERRTGLNSISSYMPDAMVSSFSNKNDEEKARFLISGLHNCYVHEWAQIYEAIVIFVWNTYKRRKDLYDEMDSERTATEI